MIVLSLVLLGLGAFETQPAPRDADPDSLRLQVGSLAKAGKLDAALALVESSQATIAAPMNLMLQGKLELNGPSARKAYESVVADSNADSTERGEALFRLGQYFYAAEQHHNAIPQFREYLKRYPRGAWADAAGYWMGYSCLQFARLRPHKTAYLDTGLNYTKALENRNRPNGYYLSLALGIEARLFLAKGDTAAAQALLKEYRMRAPAEELPGALLLSACMPVPANATPPENWWDSLRVRFPKSPEARLPGPVHANSRPMTPPHAEPATPGAAARLTLQLGAFSQAANAEQLRLRLAAKGLNARKEEFVSGGKKIYRVLYGDYADAESAEAEGKRLLQPWGYLFEVLPRP